MRRRLFTLPPPGRGRAAAKAGLWLGLVAGAGPFLSHMTWANRSPGRAEHRTTVGAPDPWLAIDHLDRGRVRVRPLSWSAAGGAVSAAAVIALRRIARAERRESRAAAGLCPACGYDLRATPGRCPECGAVPAGEGGSV